MHDITLDSDSQRPARFAPEMPSLVRADRMRRVVLGWGGASASGQPTLDASSLGGALWCVLLGEEDGEYESTRSKGVVSWGWVCICMATVRRFRDSCRVGGRARGGRMIRRHEAQYVPGGGRNRGAWLSE